MTLASTVREAVLPGSPANLSAKTPGNWRFLLQAHHAKCVEFATFHAQTRASLGLTPRGHKGNWRFLLQAHHAKCVEFATFHAQTRASLGLTPRGHKGNWLPRNSRRIDHIELPAENTTPS